MYKLLSLLIIFSVNIICSINVKPISNFIGIKINEFTEDFSITQTLNDIQLINKDAPLNLIIDLRDNSGGNLYKALEFSALFVTKNALIKLKSTTKSTTITKPKSLPFIKTERLLILINAHTASAAEAATHILLHNKHAISIGRNTMGKSTITSESSNDQDYTRFILPAHHISPDIFYKFNPANDLETQYLNAIKLSNQIDLDSVKKERSIVGNK